MFHKNIFNIFNCVKKLVALYHVWRELQKNANRNKTCLSIVAKKSQADLVIQPECLRNVEKQKRRAKYVSFLTASTLFYEALQENMSSESTQNLAIQTESTQPTTVLFVLGNKTVLGYKFIAPKLVASLDRCQLSMRNYVMFIVEATVEALGHYTDAMLYK